MEDLLDTMLVWNDASVNALIGGCDVLQLEGNVPRIRDVAKGNDG